MRLPHSLLESPYFLFGNEEEFLAALGAGSEELHGEVRRLITLGLPPIASRDALATLLGINPGLVWSFEYRANKHYRMFTIPKGRGQTREIFAPRVALKVVQKWLSVQLQRCYTPPAHVFGFVSNRSHIDAAKVHRRATWVLSVDVESFFPSTPRSIVAATLEELGFRPEVAQMLARIVCRAEYLPQGAPTSPVISNLVFRNVDAELASIAEANDVRLSRYADDIVFSGTEQYRDGLLERLQELFASTPWSLAPKKIELSRLPARLKVHGLLVHGEQARLTKGYRNKLRAYRHLLGAGRIQAQDLRRVMGHLQYLSQVEASED